MNSPLRGDMSVLDDGVVEVPVEALFDVGHVLDLGVAVQYSTVKYSTVQYSKVQYSTVKYSTVQYSTVQYSTVQ